MTNQHHMLGEAEFSFLDQIQSKQEPHKVAGRSNKKVFNYKHSKVSNT